MYIRGRTPPDFSSASEIAEAVGLQAIGQRPEQHIAGEGGWRHPGEHGAPARPQVDARSGVCLIMTNKEVFKPSNTGWLIADVVRDNHAFIWSRTETDPKLLALLRDPQWQPYLVFPGEYVEPERVTNTVEVDSAKRPLFILLDATWTEARKIFRKSPYFDALPILSLLPEKLSRYRLRRSTRSEHLCTAEVAALCLDLAGDVAAASALDAYFDVFSQHYLDAKHQLDMNVSTPAHAELMPFVHSGYAALG